MSDKPFFSVIMPAYNRAGEIKYSMDSVLSQTFSDLELIIIDDGSTDNTKEVIDSYNDPRIVYIRKENGGVASARNAGLRAARGQWVSFCDSDDLFFKDRLEVNQQMINKLAGPALLYSGWMRFTRVSDDIIIHNYLAGFEKQFNEEIYQYKNIFTTSAVTLNRKCIDECGNFDENLNYEEDWELFLRVSDKFNIIQMDRPTFFYQIGNTEEIRIRHHRPENVRRSREYIAKKRSKYLLDEYLKNKNPKTGRNIMLALMNSTDQEYKAGIVKDIVSFNKYLSIYDSRAGNGGPIGMIGSESADPFFRYMIKTMVFDLKLKDVLAGKKDDMASFQEAILNYFR